MLLRVGHSPDEADDTRDHPDEATATAIHRGGHLRAAVLAGGHGGRGTKTHGHARLRHHDGCRGNCKERRINLL